MSNLNAPIGVTFFADPWAKAAREEHLSLRELAARVMVTTAPNKAALPWLKLALFGDTRTAKGSLRNNANLLFICGVEADYDQDTMTPAEAVGRLEVAKLAAVVYTSPSHTATRNRWRVLCPTSEWLAPGRRRALLGRLNAVLGGVLSLESFTLSQAYYYGQVGANPAHNAWLVEGRCIDEADDLTDGAYPPASKPVAVPVLPAGLAPDAYTQAALERVGAMFADPAAIGQRHQAAAAATMLLAPLVKSGHLDHGLAVQTVADAMELSGRTPNDGEIDALLSGALPKVPAYVPDTGGAEFGAEAPPAAGAPALRELTEDAVALAFARTHGDRFRYDVNAGGSGRESMGAWFTYQPGDGWRADDRFAVIEAARDFVRAAREQRGLGPPTLGASSVGFTRAVVRFCQSDKHMVMTAADWDNDPLVLGVPGGWVDLRTGDLHPAEPAMFIRRRAAVAPSNAAIPTWLRFLHDATLGDAAYIDWLQRWCGYVLTGDMREECFAFVHGPGGNGKSVFLGVLTAILGEYVVPMPTEVFRADARVNRESYMARLDGARLVTASETEAGHALAESAIKELTGNEGRISARRLYAQPFEFWPTCKLVISGNHAPTLKGRTDAMERRMRVLPFTHKPPVPDRHLKDRLAAEYPGILRWMIDGCLAWQRDRLGVCDKVRGASESYFAEQDTLTQWAADRCVLDVDATTPSRLLLEDFNTWLRARGERSVDARAFKEQMAARLPRVVYGKSGVSVYRGVSLRPSDASEFGELVS